MDRYCLKRNSDGSFDLYIYLDRLDAEFSGDFFSGRLFGNALKAIRGKKGTVAVRAVKLVVAGSFVISIPFIQFAAKGVSEDSNFAMSYIYFGTVAEQIQDVTLSAEVLNTVSPGYFTLNSDGTLSLNGISTTFIDAMHNLGIKVVPFLTNGWNRQTGIGALDNMESLTDSIAQTVIQYNLDGVNVDLENLTEAQRDEYALFVKTLREKLPEGKEVSVAVAANPWGTDTGWQGSYDYAALSKYADYLMIMTYDEHYPGGTAGAVASIDFVEDSIRYALTKVESDKIVVGIPFYGRLWSTDGTINGEGISLKQIASLIGKYRYKIFFDEESETPVVHITVDEPFTLNGKTIKSGNYAIWYENADSLKRKLALVGKYGIRGTGNWSSGQETPDVWDYYELWLNGHYFSDIDASFAKDDILELTSDGILKGTTDTLFEPDKVLTRAQAAVIFSRASHMQTEDGETAGFSDTAGHWAEAEIAAAEDAGLIRGYEDGTFRPDEPVGRDEMAVMIARMLELSYHDSGDAVFRDVSEGYWAYDEIMALAKLNLLRGYGDSTFRPQQSLTRAEAAAIIQRVLDESGS